MVASVSDHADVTATAAAVEHYAAPVVQAAAAGLSPAAAPAPAAATGPSNLAAAEQAVGHGSL